MVSVRPKQRPGGRTARVRADVHTAAKTLLAEHGAQHVTIAMVAERSGVHQATIYRRWGTMLGLIEDVVTEQLAEAAPVPDTGSLRGDLEQYARGVATDLANPLGLVLLQAAAFGGESTDPAGDPPQRQPYARRVSQLQVMLDRASERREHSPTAQELVEVLLMPMYGHLLFMRTPAPAEYALMLVDRLLTLAATRSS